MSVVNPDTVSELNVPQYLGLWYQMYEDEAVVKSFEEGSYCCTALYGDNGDGTLSVHNYASQNSPDGTQPYVIDGYAYQTNPEQYPGQLKVKFTDGQGAPFPAPYWILELGPVVNGLYDYAIVSDSVSAYLFVLARDVQRYYEKYDAQVQKSLEEKGFTGKTAPIKMYQGNDCVYEATKVSKPSGANVTKVDNRPPFAVKTSGSTCTGPHEFCCEAPAGDPNNCPPSARTSDCDKQGSCCCA